MLRGGFSASYRSKRSSENADQFATPAKAGVQAIDFTGFRFSPE